MLERKKKTENILAGVFACHIRRLLWECFEPINEEAVGAAAELATAIEITDEVYQTIADKYLLSIERMNDVVLNAMLLIAVRQEFSADRIDTEVSILYHDTLAVEEMIREYFYKQWNVHEAEINFPSYIQ